MITLVAKDSLTLLFGAGHAFSVACRFHIGEEFLDFTVVSCEGLGCLLVSFEREVDCSSRGLNGIGVGSCCIGIGICIGVNHDWLLRGGGVGVD